ncbi:FAD synthetase family protein [Secundilactobacillus malefermentans]|uniref:FAD synthetase family protein n=1 Tax=Secundilactobacillus malefermentans TaxID=176292 RepID=UPI0011C7B248|nr:FAD synthetase family protein [Secundilactobacillus malefermentans]QEA31016.1 FAD synthetase family protein [Secundilactobacillus malefermentans]
MQVDYLSDDEALKGQTKPETVLVLGFFDGVHRGHQHVIQTARKLANKYHLPLSVMTFDQHPSQIFKTASSENFRYLNTVDQKVTQMEKNKVDCLYITRFTKKFASLSPQQFVDQYIVQLNAKLVVVGFDYTFGAGASATGDDLKGYSHQQFDVKVVHKLTHTDVKVSSTRIRALIKAGKVELANTLLGYKYETNGRLIKATDGQYGIELTNSLQQIPTAGRFECQMLYGKRPLSVFVEISAKDGLLIIRNQKMVDAINVKQNQLVSLKWLKLISESSAMTRRQHLFEISN